MADKEIPDRPITRVQLTGCTPEPLMGYLKAIGVFRLIAEQADPQARLSWEGGIPCLTSHLTRQELIDFFVTRYQPTPIVAPWNGGSGFYSGGRAPLELIEHSDSDRLRVYRDTLQRIRQFLPESKPKDDAKGELLEQCRGRLPDEVVPWLDACFVLGESGAIYFPLLGTGGNDGRLDFTNNFLQRIAEIVPVNSDDPAPASTERLLEAALFADVLVALGKTSIGQFSPGGIGGPNGTQGRFEADSRVNPWDFVLMIEGTLLFAGSAARRLGQRTSLKAVFPFSVDSVAVGYGSAAASEETNEGSRAETWLPLWQKPATLAELRHLFAEGRAQCDRRQARNSVEFALAVNLLGVNRGVKSFLRYGFLKRNGLAYLATPLGRVDVQLRPNAHLLQDPPLVEWVDRWRRACGDKDKTPQRFQAALRQIDRAMFAFARRSDRGNDAPYLLDVLLALGNAERTLSRGLSLAQEKYLRPLQGLSTQWLEQADDGSPEFRLAAALAGIAAPGESVGPFRTFLEEVEVSHFVDWAPGNKSAVWSQRALASNLAAVFRRRQLEAFRAGVGDVPVRSPRPARLSDVVSFLTDQIEDDKLTSLVWALSLIQWQDVSPHAPERDEAVVVPFEFGVLRLLVEPIPVAQRVGRDSTGTWIQPDPQVLDTLASPGPAAVCLAVARAARRLKTAGLTVVGYRHRQRLGHLERACWSSLSSERLLASLLFPLSARDLQGLADRVLYSLGHEE